MNAWLKIGGHLHANTFSRIIELTFTFYHGKEKQLRAILQKRRPFVSIVKSYVKHSDV